MLRWWRANSGELPDASAAPRANAISCSSGTLTVSEVAASSAGLIRGTSTPEPTTKKPSGRALHRLSAGNQVGQFGYRGVVIVGQLPATHVAQRTVRGIHHGQSRTVGLDEQHAGPLVADGTTDRLPHRDRRQERGHEHDVFDLASGQRVAQRGRLNLIGPAHADGGQPEAGVGRTLAGAQNGRNHLIGRAGGGRVAGQAETIFFDDYAVGVFTLDQRDADSRRCHRNPEYDVQNPSQRLCQPAT